MIQRLKFFFALLPLLAIPLATWADCTSPAGKDGELRYASTDKTLYVCSDTTWRSLNVPSAGAVATAAIFPTAGTTCPSGYLPADGSTVSRTSYSALFAAIGVIYGDGDGSTTFQLPDYRGLFVRGLANGSSNDPDRASRTDRGDGTTGDAVGTKQTSGTETHVHSPGTLAGDAQLGGTHPHSLGTLAASDSTSSGDHSHTPGSLTGSANSAGSHSHGRTSVAASTSSGGDHTHTFGYNQQHNADTGRSAKANTVGFSTSGPTSSAGSHSHTATLSGSTSAVSAHNHTASVDSGATDSEANHSHGVSFSGSSTTAGAHSHTFTLTGGTSSAAGQAESRPINISVLYCIKI